MSRESQNGAQDQAALETKVETLKRSVDSGNALREADSRKFQERLAEQVNHSPSRLALHFCRQASSQGKAVLSE